MKFVGPVNSARTYWYTLFTEEKSTIAAKTKIKKKGKHWKVKTQTHKCEFKHSLSLTNWLSSLREETKENSTHKIICFKLHSWICQWIQMLKAVKFSLQHLPLVSFFIQYFRRGRRVGFGPCNPIDPIMVLHDLEALRIPFIKYKKNEVDLRGILLHAC